MPRLITYYQRERFIKAFSLTLMVVFLIVNLFPIFWMVFSSFKNNNDILGGNVGFSRVKKDIYSFNAEKDFVDAFSIDGSITRYRKSDYGLVSQVTIKGQNPSFTQDSNYYYMTLANRGLFKINKTNLKIVGKAKNPVTNVDTNKMGYTSVVIDDRNVYYAVELKGLNNIYVYDKMTLKYIKTIALKLSQHSFIRYMHYAQPYIYIGTESGLVKYNPKTENIIKFVSFGGNYLPSGIQKILKVDGDNIIFLAQSGLLYLDMQKEIVTKRSNYGINRYEDSFVSGTSLYTANSGGLYVIDLKKDEIVKNYKNLVKELKDGIKISSTSQYNSDEVTTVYRSGKDLILGSSFGRISIIKEDSLVPYKDLQLPAGYRLIKWQNYIDLDKNISFMKYLINSFIISLFTSIIAMILATLASYALTRYNFIGNKEFGIAILSTQMIPQIMYLIPLFVMFIWITKNTGIPVKGTFAGLIFIYAAFFVPFSIWILRSFFASIPVELEESAKIDGCNGFQVFWKIALPLAIPGIIATGIYIFLTAWDELMFAWVLTSADTMTIPVGIRLFVGNFQNRYDLMMAAATVATLPVLVLFFILQKYIVKGLTAGAVKG